MKVLAFGVNSPDYMQDDLYHGLKSVLGRDLECNVNISYLYDDYPHDIRDLYGKGISYAKNLDHNIRTVVSGPDIFDKISSNYYDAIIYLSRRRCMDKFAPLIRCMNSDRIAFVDGEDDTEICFVNGSLNFKRELTIPPNSKLFPISFAIPHDKLCTTSPIKVRLMSGQIPGLDRKYMFDTEAKYYEEYRQSKFAITTKKAGWDCKRHYEILANKCIPVFQQISSCPNWTMTTLPKRFLGEVERTFATATDATYENWLAELTAWTHERLTTVKLAHYVLEKLCL